MKKQKQMQIVYNIVKCSQFIRTEQVKIQAMYEGVSCADRYLRWLQEQGRIRSFKAEKSDKTKTWMLQDATIPLKQAQNVDLSPVTSKDKELYKNQKNNENTLNSSQNGDFKQQDLFK